MVRTDNLERLESSLFTRIPDMKTKTQEQILEIFIFETRKEFIVTREELEEIFTPVYVDYNHFKPSLIHEYCKLLSEQRNWTTW